MGTVPATIRRSNIGDFRTSDRIQLMIQDHVAELHLSPPTVPWDVFGLLEEGDRLFADVAEFDGEPVGYCVMSVGPSEFWSEKLFARILAIYVDPHHRGAGVGMEMICRMKREAVSRKADFLSVHMPNKRSEKMMHGLGFDLLERHYMMDLS